MADLAPAGDSGGTATAVADSGSPTTTSVSPDSTSPGTTSAAGVQTTDTPKGPIPYDRFEEINRKYSSLKWAESHDPTLVQQQAQFFRWLDSDPTGAHEYLTSYLTRAGVLKAKEAAKQGEGDSRPQPDIVVPETGQRFYSAEAAEKLAQWHATQATSPIEKRLQSMEAHATRSAAADEAARLLRQAESWPHYKEHEGDILREMDRDRRLTLEGAYNRVVVPKLRELERQSVLSELRNKSQASTVSPGTQSASQTVPSHKLGWSELFRRELAKRGGRA